MPLIPSKNTAADAAQKIRQIVTQTSRQAIGACRQINRIVTQRGRTNVLDALGEDAADLLAFHDDIAGMALKYTGVTLDALPGDPEPEEPEKPKEPEAPADPA